MVDFFISYTKVDLGWATWIAWQLEAAGYTAVYQNRDFKAGGNWQLDMDNASKAAKRTIAVLSPNYLKSRYGRQEWAVALQRDPEGKEGALVPVRVEECKPEGSLATVTYIDLVGQSEANARELLLSDVKQREKPKVHPRFPGTLPRNVERGLTQPPVFPGALQTIGGLPAKKWNYSRLVLERTLKGTGDELFSVAFSPDGKLVAAGSDQVIFIWDRKHPTRRRQLLGHKSYVYSVAFSSDSRFLASGGEDKLVRVWDLQLDKLRWSRATHTEAVYSVAFSPDDSRLASGGYDRVVNIRDAETGQLQLSTDINTPPTGRVSSVAFSPDSTTLAIGRLDDTVTLWEINARKIHVLEGHTSSVETVAFSPNGRLLASGGLDKTVRVWDVTTKQLKWAALSKEPSSHEYLVRSVAFSHDGATLASASWDKTVKLWKAETGEYVQKLPLDEDFPWHTDWIWSIAFSPEPEGMVLASGGSDSQIFLWSVAKS